MSASPECVAPGGRLEVTWTAVDQKTFDAVALLPSAARNDEYTKNEYTNVSTVGGRLIFPAPSTQGSFEFRLIREGNLLAVSQPISVRDGCATRSLTAPLEGFSMTAKPDCVAPNGRLDVTWTAVDQKTFDAVALMPAPAKNEDYTKNQYNNVSTAGGHLIFPAPSTPGEVEVRLLRDGIHLAVSQPITVSNDCPQ